MISTGLELTAPQPVISVIDHLYRDVSVAEAARRGRFTHAGVELELGRIPDWVNSGLSDDVEWRIEWVKLYEGLDLAHAYALTGETDYLAVWEDLVESFCDQVAVGTDVADVSARRLQNWLYAWRRFADAPTFTGLRPGLAERLAQRIADDAEHLRHNLTRHRNHRTLELYALFIVGLSLPDSDPDLAQSALTLLGENLLTDVWTDGVHRECSTDYHCIVLRSYLGALANARAVGLELPNGYLDRVSLALDFALHIQRPDGLTPSFSDGDIVDFRRLLALGAELLDRDDLRWVATGGEAGTPPTLVDATFPVGGYLSARSGWGDASTAYGDERFLLMDAGPIGDGGHGHYDQLSIELYAHGRSMVVDPGRYTYIDNSWRRWFKGSAGHNTVTVDGLDQTPYRRAAPKDGTSQARLVRRVSRPDFDAIEAEVTSPQHEVVHTRRVLFPQREYWIVHDHLCGDTNHRYEARWHLPTEAEEHVAVVRHSGYTTVTTPAGNLTIAAPATVEIDPGWVSPTYGVRHRAPVVVVHASGIEADIVTVLSPGGAEVALVDQTERGTLHCRVERGSDTDLVQWSAHSDRDVAEVVVMTMATASHGVRLATDPALPQRDLLLDPDRVAERLSGILHHGTTIESCSVRRVKYRIGESLRVVYDVVADGRPFVLSARTFADSAGVFRKAESRAEPVPGMPGVVHDPGTSTVWWALPNDRKMTNLATLLDPPAIVRRSSGVEWRSSELVEYAPEKSATVRIVGHLGQVSGFGKAYLDHDALDVADQYNRIAASISPLDGIGSPRALGWSRPDRIVVLEPMSGRPWTQLPNEVQPDAMRRLGSALANIHALPIDIGRGPFQRYRPERVLNSADLVAVARPDVADALRTVRTQLADGPPAARTLSCLHGDVHANNMLFDGDRVHMIDFDQGGSGAAAADIGSVLATLSTARLLRPDAAVEGLGAALLDGYGAVRPIPDGAELRWYTAAALVVERAIRAVNRVNQPVLAVLPELIEMADAVLAGKVGTDA